MAAVGGFYLTRGLNTVSKEQIRGIDPSSISDGIYEGTYSEGRWANKVAVTIKGGKITDIKIIKDVTFSRSEVSEDVIEEVLDEQNTTIDAVSGATVTTKAYLKAIENALTKK